MRDKKFMFVIVLGLVFLLTVGLTYAYFSLTVSGNDVAETINVNTTKLELKYTDGKEIKANSIEPGWTITKSLTIENTGSEEVYYDLGWQELTNEIEQDELKISGTCDSGSCEDIDVSIVPLVSNQKAGSGKVVNPYKSGIAIAGGETHTYTIKLEFINYNDKAQNYNQGKKVSGVLGIAESTKTFNLTLSLEDDSGNPLANKEVTLHSEPKTSVSDSDGIVVFNDVEVGDHSLEVKTDNKTLNTKIKVQGSNSSVVEKNDNNYVVKGKSNEEDINLGVKASNNSLSNIYVKGSKISSYLVDNYSALGLTKISQVATGNQNYNTTEYRYQGANPNNYITFNDEIGVWRVIGVFEAETSNGDGTYKKENKVKIVRDALDEEQWNTTNSNDWTTAELMNTLNSGYYYNRGDIYSKTGLTTKAKSQLSSTKWYLGNITWTGNIGTGNTKEIYAQERSTSVHSGNSQTWDGKVGLIYASDYMYASSGCYNDDSKKGADMSSSDSDYTNETCTSSNWLYDSNSYWTISPISTDDSEVTFVYNNGALTTDFARYMKVKLRPTLYLSASVEFLSGSGTTSDPFIIK